MRLSFKISILLALIFSSACALAVPKSKVVIVRCEKVFKTNDLFDQQKVIDEKVLSRMMSVGVKEFFGVSKEIDGWKQVFDSNDKVAIKVNAFDAYYAPPIARFKAITHPQLVALVAEKLILVGVRPDHIVVFDRESSNMAGTKSINVLKMGGYQNYMPKGVRVVSGGKYGPLVVLKHGEKVNFLNELYDSNKMINMPILKAHAIMGFTFALKNNMGLWRSASIKLNGKKVQYSAESSFHQNAGVPGIADLDDYSVLKHKTVLIVGDMLRIGYRSQHYDPAYTYPYDGIIIGTDPVAVDAVAWHILQKIRKLKHMNYFIFRPLEWDEADSQTRKALRYKQDHLVFGGHAGAYLHDAAKRGLGVDDMKHIELKIINLK